MRKSTTFTIHRLWQPLSVAFYALPFVFLATVRREGFAEMIICVGLLFAIYAYAIVKRPHFTWKWLVAAAFLVRLPFFFRLPQLSDDFYRFLWDGLMLASGHNPFGAVPSATDMTLFADKAFAEVLFVGMNSADFGSVYPPLHQGVFWFGTVCSGGSLLAGVNAMRMLILMAEVGMALYFVRHSGVKSAGFMMAAYLLNPLVVVEGVGNVHLEAIMLPLLAVGLHLLLSQKTVKGSLLFAGSVLAKLTPLLLAPLLFFRKEESNRWLMSGLVAGAVVPAFLPFAPWRLLEGIDTSFGLYFQRFEFNASVYYLLREVVTPFLGYNPIGVLGPVLGAITVLLVLWLAVGTWRLDFYTAALYSYLAYYLLATTVHPWYLLPVVYLSLAAKRPVWLVWSFTVWLSYSHYLEPVGSKWGWTGLEYGVLAMAVVIDAYQRRRVMV